MLDDATIRTISTQLERITGLPHRLENDERSAEAAFCVWDAGVHIRYVLAVSGSGARRSVSIGVERFGQPMETRYEASLSGAEANAFLGDPSFVVGVMVGQRRGPLPTAT